MIQCSIKTNVDCPLCAAGQKMLLRYDFHGPLTQSNYEAQNKINEAQLLHIGLEEAKTIQKCTPYSHTQKHVSFSDMSQIVAPPKT